MSEEDIFGERALTEGEGHFERDTGEIGENFSLSLGKDKTIERRCERRDGMSEFLGDRVAEVRGSQFGEGEPSGGNHQTVALEGFGAGPNDEGVGFFFDRLNPHTGFYF